MKMLLQNIDIHKTLAFIKAAGGCITVYDCTFQDTSFLL